jgi:hypothetical protein
MRTPFIPNGLVEPPPPYAEPPDLVSSAASERGVLVERRVADQEPVVEHPVGHVHQHVEVRVLG